MEILRHIFLLFFSSYVIWKVCDSFQQASRFLGRHMPNGTRGATINAIGSSFPEFMTSFIAIFEYARLFEIERLHEKEIENTTGGE